MMIKTRVIFLVLCLTLVITLIAGATMAADATVTIQYGFWGNPAAIGVEKDIIDRFEYANPGIKVTPIAVGYADYHPKMLTMIAGGQAPDVMRIDSYCFADFMKAKAFKDLGTLIRRDKIDLKWYYEAALGDCVSKGRYYGLPWASAPILMFLNKKMFKEAGIPIPSPDWKWDDFVSVLRGMRKGEGVTRQYGFDVGTTSYNGILPFVWGVGGDLFDKDRKKFTLDSPEAVKRIQELADLVKQGLLADPAEFAATGVGSRMFFTNKLAMKHDSVSFLINAIQVEGLEWMALPFPSGDKTSQTTINKANVVGIAVSTKNLGAAWTFLKFLRGPGGAGERLYMKAKRMPPTGDDPEMWELYSAGGAVQNVPEIVKLVNRKYAHTLPLVAGWTEIESTIVPQLQRIFSGQITAEAGMKEIAPKVQSILDRNK